jgi:hypothetical protein
MPSTIATAQHVLQMMSLEQCREALPLAGFPSRGDVRHTIDRALHHARAGHTRVFLITPQAQRLRLPADAFTAGNDPDDQLVLLPPVRCVGHFRADPIRPQSGAWHSELTFLWWQDNWGAPIDPEIRKVIAAVDWRRHARDVTD